MDCDRPKELPILMWRPDPNRVTKMDKFRERVNNKFNLKLVLTCTTCITVIAEGREEVEKRTFRELADNVAVYAAAMKKMGIKEGDRVVGYIPNCCVTIEAMLGAASLGAVWSSTSPDFGVTGVLDRFTQIQPKLIFSVDAVRYNGKQHAHLDKLQKVVEGLPELEKVVIIPYVNKKEDIDISSIPKSLFLDDFLASGKDGETVPPLEFAPLPFNHPLYIMYSSGTTGPPKCMGTLIQHLKEHVIHGNMDRDDIMLYYTTYTISGKKVEVAVKRILAGEDIQQRGAYSNPESLDLYYHIPELQGNW
uniref:AMP-dependent synthetase/ligase domain-containing protein n=1 Tax=Branchiostoma floridae TaxID=7739 RepID=C3ZKL6_BRAFL|eukprot:XP_002590918.1 hypothetical protein BRAFLDRAFT_108770 [Branchiostoma floridae]